ncbi:MAG: hypothetical protein IGQ88_12490 [Gloeomargaritaceae cyanobacterium C42_A2020_066]|nr:hypothetical protein [Gloeomargaritaceae cyanobacterium C42_A2020_066]
MTPLALIPPSDLRSALSGDVHLAPDVVVGPGVLLLANPGSQIRIGSGVCLGMGVIIHAYGGAVVVETGAILGAGVLIVGTAHIGAQSCVGSTTTVYNAAVPAGQMVAPGSLIEPAVPSVGRPASEPAPEVDVWAEENPSPTLAATPPMAEVTPEVPPPAAPQIYGLNYFQSLRVTLLSRPPITPDT